MEKVFVYGTLRKGFSNHHYLKNSKFLGKARTKERYTMVAASIPFVNKTPSTQIVGEVYEVDVATLKKLDVLEGHPNWYIREKVPVILEDGQEIEAWIYFNDREHGEFVETGDYANYRRYPSWV